MSVGPGFLRLAAMRSSVRRYRADRAVGDGEITAVLEAARLAPSAENAQPWRFVVVRDPSVRQRLVEEAFSGVYRRSRRIDAPVFFALCGVHGAVDLAGRMAGHASYTLTDCGIAGEHVVLAAADLGLGPWWVGLSGGRRARGVRGIPAGVDLIALIALGWPADPARETPPAKGRRSLSAIAWTDRWGTPFVGGQSAGV
jgi:nitroreductase